MSLVLPLSRLKYDVSRRQPRRQLDGPLLGPGGCLGPSHAKSDASGVVSGPAGPWGAKILGRSPHMSSHGFHIVRVNGVNSMVGPRGPPPPGVRCISCYVLANAKGIVNQRAGPRHRGQDMKRPCLPCTQFIEQSFIIGISPLSSPCLLSPPKWRRSPVGLLDPCPMLLRLLVFVDFPFPRLIYCIFTRETN